MSPFMTRVRFVLGEVWQGISRSITLTIALIATFAISLSLLGVSLLVGSQVNEMKDYWFDKVEHTRFQMGFRSCRTIHFHSHRPKHIPR